MYLYCLLYIFIYEFKESLSISNFKQERKSKMSDLPHPFDENPNWDIITTFSDGKYAILTYENDPKHIPHFHIVDTKSWGQNFHCRILINKPKYYRGETSKLTKRDIKNMCNSLDSILDGVGVVHSFSQWEYLINTWNCNTTGKIQVKETKKRPDYFKSLN